MVIRYAPVQPAQAAAHRRGPIVFRGGDALPASIRLLERLAALKARVRRRALRMTLAAALPLAAAAAILAMQPQVYRSSASVFVDPQAARPARADGGTDAAILNGQLRLATSRTVLQKAIDQGRLAEGGALKGPDGILAALAKAALKAIGIDAAGTQDRAGGALQVLSAAVQARPGDGANLIEIAATAGDAGVAARIANAVAQAFVDEIVASADAVSGSERSRLSRREDDLKARLQDAEAKLAQFRARNGLDAAAARPASAEMDAASELTRLRLAAADARARYEQLQKLMAGGKEPEVIADLVRSPSVERLKAQYNDAAAQEVSFRSSLGPRHPAYLEVLQQAKEKKRLLQEGLRLALTAARIEWQSAREQEMAAEKRAGSETPAQVPTTPPLPPTQLRELEREAEIARAAYDRFLRANDALDSGAQGVAARLVAPAAAPLAPQSQGRGRLIGGALLASILFAGLTAIGRDKPRPSRETPRPAPQRAVVAARRPSDAAPAPDGPEFRDARPKSPAAATPPQRPAPSSAPDLAGVEGLARELAQASGEFVLQTVLATALSPAADKSAAALALAQAAMQCQLRVLLIDADGGDASLSARYGGGAVAGTIPIQGRPRPLVVADAGASRVCFVPTEARAPAPPDLPTLPAVGGIAGNYDLVIIDGPVLAGTLQERKLARAAQAVMLACGPGEMPSLSRVSILLGVSAETFRIVRPPVSGEAAGATSPAGQRPMGVVRLRKVA